jgi:hypothetical protein
MQSVLQHNHPIGGGPLAFPDGPLRIPCSRSTPDALPSPILSGMSRPRLTAPRLAVRNCGVLPPRAGGAASTASEQRPLAEAGGDNGGAKMPLVFPIRSYPSPSTCPAPRYHHD